MQIQISTPNLLAQELFFHHLHKCTLEADRLLGSAVERRVITVGTRDGKNQGWAQLRAAV